MKRLTRTTLRLLRGMISEASEIADCYRNSSRNNVSREERRYLERKNKSERTRKKKEENARIIKLVDQATKLDPRIKKFKEEERAAKEAIRREKEDARKAIETAKLKQAEEERLAREKADAEEKARVRFHLDYLYVFILQELT